MNKTFSYAKIKYLTMGSIAYRSIGRGRISTSTFRAVGYSGLFLRTIRNLDQRGYWQELKKTVRSGWVGKVPNPESVADHSLKLAALAFRLGRNRGLSLAKLIDMALVHDLPEAVTSDLTPSSGISPDEKHEREETAMRAIMRDTPNGDCYLELFLDYSGGRSPEAKFLKQLDKLEMVITALKYEKSYPDKTRDFDEFWEYAERLLFDPFLRAFFLDLQCLRIGR